MPSKGNKKGQQDRRCPLRVFEKKKLEGRKKGHDQKGRGVRESDIDNVGRSSSSKKEGNLTMGLIDGEGGGGRSWWPRETDARVTGVGERELGAM